MSRKLLAMGGQPELRVGYTTFYGNQIVDVHGLNIDQALKMEDEINKITGVLENGIFARDAADVLVLGTAEGAKVILLVRINQS